MLEEQGLRKVLQQYDLQWEWGVYDKQKKALRPRADIFQRKLDQNSS